MAKGSLRVNGIIVDADGELKASTGDSIVIREDDGSAVITVDTSGNVLIGGPTTVGVDDSGHDVKFFGATSGAYMLWDESQDDLILGGVARLGIGITSPSQNLDVLNTAQITGAEGTSASLYLVADEGDDNGDGWRINSNQDVNDLTISNNTSGSYVDKLSIGTNGQVTFVADPTGFNYVATVTAAQTNSTTGIVIGNSGTAAAGVTVAHADTTNQASVNNSGRTYIQDITLDTFGHITGITSATETVTDTTYSVASGTALGLVKIGYTENAKNYPVELGSGTNADKMFVNVPWTDTNTTYSVANSSTLGLIKIGYTESGKNYPVELSSEKAYVNVPWTDTNTTYSAGTGLSLSGTTFNLDDGYCELIELHEWSTFWTVSGTAGNGYKAAHDTTQSVTLVSGYLYEVTISFQFEVVGVTSFTDSVEFAVGYGTSSLSQGNNIPVQKSVIKVKQPSGESYHDHLHMRYFLSWSGSNTTIYPAVGVQNTSGASSHSVRINSAINMGGYRDGILLTVKRYKGVSYTSSTGGQ